MGLVSNEGGIVRYTRSSTRSGGSAGVLCVADRVRHTKKFSHSNVPLRRERLNQIITALGLTGVLIACSSTSPVVPNALPLAASTVTPIANPTVLSKPTAAPAADIVIDPQQNSTAIKVRVGQSVAISRPEDFDEWQVDYNSSVLTALTSLQRMRAPGLEGWLFRATTPGETQVVLTSLLPPCQKDAPCPNLNPERFVITLQVQQ